MDYNKKLTPEEIQAIKDERAKICQIQIKKLERIFQIIVKLKAAGGPFLFPRLFKAYQLAVSTRIQIEIIAAQPIPLFKPGGHKLPFYETAILAGPAPYTYKMKVPPGMTKKEMEDKLRPKISQVFLVDDQNNIFELKPRPGDYPPAPPTYTFKLDYKEIEPPTDTNKTPNDAAP